MLLIHTALHAEAHALIAHLRLQRQHQSRPYAHYAKGDIHLIESGIGKLHAAAAVGWLNARVATERPAWLNIGIAGHATQPLGRLLLVRRIEDQASGRRWRLSQDFQHELETTDLLTVDQPLEQHPADSAVDMEASGFMQAAERVTDCGLIQSLKLVSDNADNPPRKYSVQEIDDWMTPHLPTIDNLIQQLLICKKSNNA